MNTKKLCKVLLMAACACCLAGCGDDNDAISLVNTQGNELITNNGTYFKLSPFSSGDTFYISGGDGAYSISNSNEAVVRFSYDGQTITFYPVGPGSSQVTIQDHSGNLYTLTVEVAYPEERFMVNSQTVSIIGGGLTQNETTTLQIRAAEELPVQLGGEYHFVYMAADSTNGELNMYKSPNDFPTTGVFQKQEKYKEDGTRYEQLNVTLASGETVIYAFSKYISNTDTLYTFQQDVTDKYKTEYPALEEASISQELQAIDVK